MNNFFEQRKNDNPANAYYPEAMNFNAETMAFSPTTNSTPPESQKVETNAMPENNPLSGLLNGQNNPLMNMLSNQSANPLSGLLGDNNPLMSLFAGGLNGGGNKTNLIMQALSSMLTPKKTTKPSEEHVEKVIEVDDSFEEI